MGNGNFEGILVLGGGVRVQTKLPVSASAGDTAKLPVPKKISVLVTTDVPVKTRVPVNEDVLRRLALLNKTGVPGRDVTWSGKV
jgi:hypothetical protein